MAYQPPATELGAMWEELRERRSEAADYFRAIADLEARLRRIEASVSACTPRRFAAAPGWPPAATAAGGTTAVVRERCDELRPPGGLAPWSSSSAPLGSESEVDSDADLGSVDEEEPLGSETPPESFFAYCTVMLTRRGKHDQYFAAWQLLMYVILLSMLSGCFLDACKGRVVLQHWGSTVGSYDTSCFYQGHRAQTSPYFVLSEVDEYVANALHFRKRYEGMSLPFLSVGLLCMTLLALYIKDANMNVMYQMALAETEQVRNVWRLLVLSGEVVRSIIVPVQVAAGAAMQLSQSENVAELIINAFAATFLLEMDGTLYALAIGPEEKQAYKRHWQVQSGLAKAIKRDRDVPNYVFLIDLFMLAFLFIAINLKAYGWSKGCDYHSQLTLVMRMILYPATLMRICMMQLAIRRMRPRSCDHAHPWHEYFKAGLKVVRMMAVGMCIALIFQFLFAQDPVYDYASIRSCFNATDLSACSCAYVSR